MADLKAQTPITCYPEPVECDCPNGSYSGFAGIARVVDTLLRYYAPPRWARWAIGIILFLWFVTGAINNWLELFVGVAKCYRIRSQGGDWADALSAFVKEKPTAPKGAAAEK